MNEVGMTSCTDGGIMGKIEGRMVYKSSDESHVLVFFLCE